MYKNQGIKKNVAMLVLIIVVVDIGQPFVTRV